MMCRTDQPRTSGLVNRLPNSLAVQRGSVRRKRSPTDLVYLIHYFVRGYRLITHLINGYFLI